MAVNDVDTTGRRCSRRVTQAINALLLLVVLGCALSCAPTPARSAGTTPPGIEATAQPGLAGVHPRAWSTTVIDGDVRTALVYFTSAADAGCEELDHVSLLSDHGRLTITVFVGVEPAANGAVNACSAVGRAVYAKVQLPPDVRRGEPIVDGATGQEGRVSFEAT
jgi:hypothetical protein